MSSYSLEEAEADAECILRDFQCDFVLDDWVNVTSFQKTVLGNNTSDKNLPAVCHRVADHCDSVKYLKFASAAIEGVSRGLVPSESKKTVEEKENRKQFDSLISLNKSDFLSQLPFTVTVADIAARDRAVSEICCSEITLNQLQKDIERDELVIDGKRIIGSHEGLDSCLAAVGRAIDNCLACCFLPPLGSSLRDELSQSILTTATRTNSGGVALHVLRSITDTEQVMLIPKSMQAGSLLIKLSVGKFCHRPNGLTFSVDENYNNEHLYWGIRGEIRAATVYEITAIHDMMEHDDLISSSHNEVIEVIYENCICLEIDTRVKELVGGTVWGGGGVGTSVVPSGKVTFRKIS